MTEDPRTRLALELLDHLVDDRAAVREAATPLAALGVDSLAVAELALTLEERLGVALEGPLDGGSTVGELLAAVERAAPARSDDGVPGSLGRLQGMADLLTTWPMWWWLHLGVEGAERVPERGPAILAMNHESALDIPVAVIACPRRIVFMAKRELFKNAFAAWSLERLGGFRVDRALFDVDAVRMALAALRRGDVLGMYPEGTRNPGELLPFLPGAAWLAVRTGAPLVPMSLLGTERAGDAKRPRVVEVRVRFGEPILAGHVEGPAERRRAAVALTSTLREAVAAGLAP